MVFLEKQFKIKNGKKWTNVWPKVGFSILVIHFPFGPPPFPIRALLMINKIFLKEYLSCHV